jgi:hypothetical protein
VTVRIDLHPTETWSAVSEQYRAALPGLASNTQIQIYAGYQHALHEAALGIARLFSHKRSIATVEPVEPAVAAIEAVFASETYNIRHFCDDASFSDSSELDSGDLAFVVLADDDPATGRLYGHSSILQELKDQRTFRIHISHAAHCFNRGVIQPAPFEVRILSLSPERALLVAGERFKVVPALAPSLPWHAPVAVSDRLAVFPDERYQAQRKAILEFETSLPKGFRPYFKSTDQQRLFDRAVIVADGLDGYAVIDELARAVALKLHDFPGSDDKLETISPCRWNEPRVTEWLLKRGEPEEVVRGLFVVEPALINPGLPDRLQAVAQTLRSLQGS